MITSVFLLAFIAVLCSLDVTAFGQFMLCRPIFCAPLFGFIMGDINTGLWIGMISEMVWIKAIPMGVAVPIDIASISIMATYWSCKYFKGTHEAAMWAMALAIPFAFFYREIDVYGRNFNIRIMHWVEDGINKNKESRINWGLFWGLFFSAARLYAFYLFAMTLGGLIFQLVYCQFPAFVVGGFKKAWSLLPILGFGAVLYNFRNIKIPFMKK
ncbi:MAG: PTS sugar transporter subunit IIC [Endomicrobia bacterium]|nr:PTS sugar transporter subunit IIC [Endomicrobiia bacterium]